MPYTKTAFKRYVKRKPKRKATAAKPKARPKQRLNAMKKYTAYKSNDLTKSHLLFDVRIFRQLMWSHIGYLTGPQEENQTYQTWKINDLYNPNYTAGIIDPGPGLTDTTVRGLTDLRQKYDDYRVNGVGVYIQFWNVSNSDALIQLSVNRYTTPANTDDIGYVARQPKSVCKIATRVATGNKNSTGYFKTYIPIHNALELTKANWKGDTTLGEAKTDGGGVTEHGVTVNLPRVGQTAYLHLQAWNLREGASTNTVGLATELAALATDGIVTDTSAMVDVAQLGDQGASVIGGKISIGYRAFFKFYTRFSKRQIQPIPS